MQSPLGVGSKQPWRPNHCGLVYCWQLLVMQMDWEGLPLSCTHCPGPQSLLPGVHKREHVPTAEQK